MLKRLLFVLVLAMPVQGWATWTVGPHTSTHSTNGNTPTTDSIDTSGNRAIFLQINADQSCVSAPHDSKNSDSIWVRVATVDAPSGVRVDLYMASGPTLIVGAGHTFTATTDGCMNYASIYAAGMNNATTTTDQSTDQITTSSASSTSVAAGSITPGQDNELLLSSLGVAISGATGFGITAGFTILESQDQTANSYGGGIAALIQTTAGTVNPSWSWMNSGSAAAINATFFNRIPNCTGSTPSLTAPTWGDLQTCHDLATNGDTITVTAGTYTAIQQLNITKYVKIEMGGTVNLTDDTCASTCTTMLMTIQESTVGSTRLKGPLNITQGTALHTSPGGVIRWAATMGGKPIITTDVHFTHTFSGSSTFFMILTNRGVISGNSITGYIADSAQCFNGASFVRHKPGDGIAAWEMPPLYGTADTDGTGQLYIEHNTLTHALEGIDVDDNGRAVIRFNTFINSATVMHGVDTGGVMGPRTWEIYNNVYTYDATPFGGDCGGPINMNGFIAMRGGTGLIINNFIDDIPSKADIKVVNWNLRRSSGVYPCWNTTTSPGAGYPSPHQVGWGYAMGGTAYNYAEGGTHYQDLEPLIFTAETGGANYSAVSVEDFDPNGCGDGAPLAADYIVANRDFYQQLGGAQTNSSSPFNGTSGTGWGTRANRPMTCTVGVTYWATDQGSWNTSGSGGQGVLDKCTATDTWTNGWYVPFDYPHPLTTVTAASNTGSRLHGLR